MKPISTLLLAAALLCGGCAHVAKHYAPPETAHLEEQSGRLSRAVSSSRIEAKNVSDGLKRIDASRALQVKAVADIGTKLADIRKVAPPELIPRISALEGDLVSFQKLQADDAAALADLQSRQVAVLAALEEANAARNEVAVELPKVKQEAELRTSLLNEAEKAWHKDSAELVAIKSKSWLYRLAGLLGLLALAGLAFLHFTGRLAVAGASIAKAL